MAHKTYRQKQIEFEERDSRAWGTFFSKLQSIQSRQEAVSLSYSGPGPNQPGRSYYSNLGFFLENMIPPQGASRVELEEYLRLVHCFDKEGKMKEGSVDGVSQSLRQAIDKKSPFGL